MTASPGAAPDGAPERTSDGHHVIVGGRRWRATDPELGQDVAARLRQHLGRARSRIGRLATEEEKAPWRARVQLAKQGLGERGLPWWELDTATRRQRAARALDRLDRLDRLEPQDTDAPPRQEKADG